MNEKFDVIVIGGGPGGTPAALQLAASGKKVLLVEESGKLGGACLFVGCIPSKIIKHSADDDVVKNAFAQGDAHTVKATRQEIWLEIQKNMDRILNGRSNAAIQQVNQMPMTFIAGKVHFVSNKEVEINNHHFWFDKAIIATGAHSFVPPFKGDGVQDVLTSEVLFSQPSLPDSMTIIGGGPIGIELAQMLTKLHVKCSIIEMMPGLLSGIVEPEFAKKLTAKIQQTGIDVFTGAKVEAINKIGEEYETVFVNSEGETSHVKAEKVLVVTGKVPTLEGLNLEATNIRFDRHGIVVNEFMETTVSGIYAAGDVVAGAPKFAHTATYESHIVAANILHGNISKACFTKNSWVLFSDPELASAGMTEAEAVKAGFEVVTGTYDYAIDAMAQISGDTYGSLKFIVNRHNQEILGVHIYLNGAASLSGEADLIVSKRMTLTEVARAIHSPPTFTEAFGFLALNMLSDHKFKNAEVDRG
ncbi:MAG: dihydrolipoyl dehydrogenase family protein [Microbacter sp.]